MDQELLQRLVKLEEQTNAIFVSVEKTRRYFFWIMVLTVVFFVVPLIGLFFAVPMFLSSYTGSLESMSGLM